MRRVDELLYPADHDGVELLVEDLDEAAAPEAAGGERVPVRLALRVGLVAHAAVHKVVSAEFRCRKDNKTSDAQLLFHLLCIWTWVKS